MKTNRAFVQGIMRGVIASLVGAILYLTTNAASAEGVLKLADSQLEPVNWTELAGGRPMITSPHSQPIRQAAKPWAKYGVPTTTD